jgi:hypothetical protein
MKKIPLSLVLVFGLATFALSIPEIVFARTFPSTKNKAISVFADQLPVQEMNDAQIRFVSEHYVGTQKLYKNQIEKIRAYNPDFLMLHYRLAEAAGEAPGIAHDSEADGSVNGNIFSAEEWDKNLQQKDWFIRDSAGNRIKNSEWNWYPFDLARSSELRNQIADYWTSRVKKEVAATQSDGVFADSYGIPFGPWSPNSAPKYAYSNNWSIDIDAAKSWLTNSLLPYSDRVWSELKTAQIPYIQNCGQLITSWDTIENYTHSDGCMIEGFTGFETSLDTVSDWKLEMNNILALAQKGKITIAQSNFTSVDNVTRRSFIVGSYLLSKGEKSYVNMLSSQNGGVAFQWYPEYDVDLGSYETIPQNIDELAWNGVYRRNFEHGFVLVNPENSAKTISFDRAYSLATFARGGTVEKDAAPPGSVSYGKVLNVTVPAQGAVFLLDNLIDSPSISVAECPLSVDQAYRTQNSSAVYYVDLDCKKRPFKNATIFFTYFDSWADVKLTGSKFLAQIPNHELGFMPLGPKYDPKYGALVKTVNDARVYFLLNGKKYWVTSENVFNELHYKWNWIEDVDQRLLDKYPNGGEIKNIVHHLDGTIIKYAGSSKVYVLVNGKKRHIPNEASFNALGYRWDRIVTLSDSESYLDEEERSSLNQIRIYGK